MVIWEYDRSKEKEKVKEAKTQKLILDQANKVKQLEGRMTSLEDAIRVSMSNILEQQRNINEPDIVKKRGWLW